MYSMLAGSLSGKILVDINWAEEDDSE